MRESITAKRTAQTLSLLDLIQMYPTKEEAIRHMERIRWGDTPCCTRCGLLSRIHPHKKRLGDYWRGICRQRFNANTGAPLAQSKLKDLRKWIDASCLPMTSRKGISAMQLSKEVSVAYPTAWYMLYRLRLACGFRMEALRGTVEVDKCYLGGLEKNKHTSKKKGPRRSTAGGAEKQAVIGLRERGGRVKAMPIKTDKKTLHGIAHSHVMSGLTICADDSPSHNGVANRHLTVNHSAPASINRRTMGVANRHLTVNHSTKERVNGMAHTNAIESVWAALKRDYNGVYHNWLKKHCHQRVNGFAFRLNEGNCGRDTQVRLDDLFRAMTGKTIAHKEITA